MSDKEKIFELMDGYVVIRSIGEAKQSQLITPKLGTYKEHRMWLDKQNFVFELSSSIKGEIEVGDRVLIEPHAKLRRMDECTKTVEEKLGIKTTKDILDDKGKKIDEEDVEKYFIVSIEDILCKIK